MAEQGADSTLHEPPGNTMGGEGTTLLPVEQTVQEKRIKSTIKVEIPVSAKFPKSRSPNSTMNELLKALFKTDSAVTVTSIPENGKEIKTIRSPEDGPKTKEEFNNFYKIDDKSRSNRPMYNVFFDLTSEKRINKYKGNQFSDETDLGKFARSPGRQIWISEHKFLSYEIVSIGIFTGVDPELVNLAELTANVGIGINNYSLENNEMMDDGAQIPTMELIRKRDFHMSISGTTREKLSASVIEIRCEKSCAEQLSNLIAASANCIPWVNYTPYAMKRSDNSTYSLILRTQNRYLSRNAKVVVLGLPYSVMENALKNDNRNVRTIILDAVDIDNTDNKLFTSVNKTSRTDDLGKWMLETTKNRRNAAVKWIDENLRNICNESPAVNDTQTLEPFLRDGPRRSDKPRESQNSSDYAKYLRNKLEKNIHDTDELQQFNSAPQQNSRKKRVVLTFDSSTFPDLENKQQKNRKQGNAWNKSPGGAATPTTATTATATTTTTDMDTSEFGNGNSSVGTNTAATDSLAIIMQQLKETTERNSQERREIRDSNRTMMETMQRSERNTQALLALMKSSIEENKKTTEAAQHRIENRINEIQVESEERLYRLEEAVRRLETPTAPTNNQNANIPMAVSQQKESENNTPQHRELIQTQLSTQTQIDEQPQTQTMALAQTQTMEFTQPETTTQLETATQLESPPPMERTKLQPTPTQTTIQTESSLRRAATGISNIFQQVKSKRNATKTPESSIDMESEEEITASLPKIRSRSSTSSKRSKNAASKSLPESPNRFQVFTDDDRMDTNNDDNMDESGSTAAPQDIRQFFLRARATAVVPTHVRAAQP